MQLILKREDMRKLLQKTSFIIYKRFTFIWSLITIILMAIALYVNWQMSLEKSYKEISETARQLSNNTDRFVEDLFQEIYTLPVYESNVSQCKKGLYPHLKHITLNSPRITGILVSSNNQLLCSTLEDASGLILASNPDRTLFGPFKLSAFDQPVYVLQQKMGNYYIGILILTSTLKSVLIPSNSSASAIELYDNVHKKSIFRIERSNSSWMYSSNDESITTVDSQAIFTSSKLYSVDGINIVVYVNDKAILQLLAFRESIAVIIILTGSCFLFFIIRNLLSKRYSLVGAIKLAIRNNEFYPAYQPLFDREKGQFSGVEVLLRWQNNEDEIIMPDLFIVEAETNGLIVPMTLQIIEICFTETKDLLKKYPDFHLAFNISASHFTNALFFNQFITLSEKYSISPAQIIFEITERDLLDKNNAVFLDKMQELREIGFSLAVDDYGTGHASISYLNHFPFNYLKIDKLFIQAIGTKAITESLNDAIISMAKRLNLIIIAEGVETVEQVNYLSENGVRYLQGWYFSKALTIEKLLTLIQGERNES